MYRNEKQKDNIKIATFALQHTAFLSEKKTLYELNFFTTKFRHFYVLPTFF